MRLTTSTSILGERTFFATFLLAGSLSYWTVCSAEQSPNVARIINALDQDESYLIANAINESLQNIGDEENLVFLRDLWEFNRSKYPTLPWQKVDVPLVRLEIADVLLQADRNGYRVMEKQPLRQYAKQHISSRNVIVGSKAILVLGLAADKRDIPLLVDIIRQEDPGSFKQAAAALASMEIDEAITALVELEKTVRKTNSKSFLRKINQRLSTIFKSSSSSDGKQYAPSSQGEGVIANAVAKFSIQDEHHLVVNAIPQLYKDFTNPSIREFTKDVWERNRERYPTLAWDLFERPSVRIPLAQLRGEMIRAFEDSPKELEQVRSYVIPFLKHSDSRLRAAGARFLGSTGTDDDIDVLKEMVMHDDAQAAVGAVVGIRAIGSERATATLEELKNMEINDRVKKLIVRILSTAQGC